MPSTRPLNLLARVALATTFLAVSLAIGGGAAPAVAAPPGYQALTPARVLDTRQNLGATGPVAAGGAITVDVTGVGGVPDSGVGAVVLNVTATNATASTFVTVWPSGQTKPNTSNLNVRPGVDTPNAVIATVGADGTIQLANEFGAVDLLADVSGWFPVGSQYNALTPGRILDTRSGLGAAGVIGAEGSIDIQVAGVGGVPASGVSAVVLNVTATNASQPTYVTVWPAGQAKPNTSNLNVQSGVDTPNLVIATVGANGKVSIANQFGSVHAIADVAGYFTSGSGYTALNPDRVLDTRAGLGAAGPVGAQGEIGVKVTGVAGVPHTGVSAVVLNVTAAGATAGTYVTVWPSGTAKPDASSLNVQPNVDTPNLVIATVGADGKVALANQFGSTHLIADVAGYFTGTPAPPPPQGLTGTLYFDALATIDRLNMANAQRTILYSGQENDTQIGYNATEFAFGTNGSGENTTVELRDLATGGPKSSFNVGYYSTGKPVMPSPNGLWIAMVVQNSADILGPDMLLITKRDGTPQALYDGVSSAAWTADGKLAFLRFAGGTGTLGIFIDATAGTYTSYWSAPFGSFDDMPTDLAIAPNGSRAAFTWQSRVYGVQLDGASQPYVAAESAIGLSSPAFSPDSSLLVVRRRDGGFCAGSMHIVPAAPAAPVYIASSEAPTRVNDGAGIQVSSCGSMYWHP